MIKGSVIVEIGQIDKKTPIEIVTPHGALTIAKAGLSRIDAKGSATLVGVRQGEIDPETRDDFMANQSLKIKRGKVVTLTGPAQPGPSDIAKLDQDAIDKFDTWSFNRAQALTAANVRALSRSGVLLRLVLRPVLQLLHLRPVPLWFWSPYGFGFFNNYRDCHSYTPYYSGGNYQGQGGNQAARSSRRVWCPAITEARLPARLTAVRLTPASIRDQADTVILARTEATLRRHRHRHRHRGRAVRPSEAGLARIWRTKRRRARQDPAAIRICGHVQRGVKEASIFLSPLSLVFLFPRLFAYGRVVSLSSFSTSEPSLPSCRLPTGHSRSRSSAK